MNATADAATTLLQALPPDRGWLGACFTRGLAVLRELGPYAAIEIVLPEGTLLALLLWIYRRYKRCRRR